MTVAIIIDVESDHVNAGLTTDDAPRLSVPSTVDGQLVAEHGVVRDWSRFETLLGKIFAELGVESKGSTVLLTEPSFNTKHDREKAVSMLFDVFGVDRAYLANPGVLALFSISRMTGVILDIEEDISYVVPICDGYARPDMMSRIKLGKRHLEDYMGMLLTDKGHVAERDAVAEIVDTLCYVAEDYDAAKQEAEEVGFDPVTHAGVSVGTERFEVPEILFQPGLFEMSVPGIHECTFHSITKFDPNTSKTLFAHVMPCGRANTLEGFGIRMQRELSLLGASTMEVNVLNAPEHDVAVWRGGDRLASLPEFESLWITRAEYESSGASIVTEKCGEPWRK